MVFRRTLGGPPMSQFQCDLFTLNKIEAAKSEVKYVLIVVDTVSRYLIFEKLLSKAENQIIPAFASVISEIRKIRKTIYSSILVNQSIIFGYIT